MSDSVKRLLLGPQRPEVQLATSIANAGIEARSFAVVSAGWQEAEGDLEEMGEAIGRPLQDLKLYQRAESLFAADASLHAAYRERQVRLQALQRLYAMRLKQLAIAARNVMRAESQADLLATEQRHAIRQLRALDRHHVRATLKLAHEFEAQWSADDHPAWQQHREAVASQVAEHDAVLITGGNLIVLLNRLRLFGLDDLLPNKTIVAWSAGAMALASRIVLFHDRMPQGRREPELLGAGLGLVPGLVVLPDGAHRLRERDRLRLGLMAKRFSPARCVVLDNASSLVVEGDDLIEVESVRRLTRGGRLVRMTP